MLQQVRQQHKRNLEGLLRHAMLTADYCTAAGAAAALLACQVPSNMLIHLFTHYE